VQQIVLNFDASEFDGFATCREYLQERVVQLCSEKKKLQKMIAADLDMAPSCLTRKLAGSEGDKRRFSLDDFERYLSTQKDMKPLFYLIDRHLIESSDEEIQDLERRLAEAKAKRKGGRR
jgi:hypothetical protein